MPWWADGLSIWRAGASAMIRSPLRRRSRASVRSAEIGSVAAPFLLMQPPMGAGFAGSRTPHPAAARLHSLVTHAIFGLGLYAAGWIASLIDL
ncbi:DUF2938 family protein [Sphingomonas koreensis]